MKNESEISLPCSKNPLVGEVSLPGSKSLVHRALIAASLARGRSEILAPKLSQNTGFNMLCEDTRVTMDALGTMGAKIHCCRDHIEIEGLEGKPRAPAAKIFLGSSGTSLRLLLSIAALCPDTTVFQGEPRLLERPMEPLIEALRNLGAAIAWGDNRESLKISGGRIPGGEVTIQGDISSQFISSLLLMAPNLEKGLTIRLASPVISRPYVDMTLDVMNSFGVDVETGPDFFRVTGDQLYKSIKYTIEGDLSAAGYFWAAAAVTRGRITTKGVDPKTRQGDRHLLGILEKMGCRIDRDSSSVTVQGGALKAVDMNMGDLPDQVPTLAVVAMYAEGTTVISGVSHLRHKESNRLEGLQEELRKLGGDIEVLRDGLKIRGKSPLRPTVLDPHNDHRLAMSFAVLGLGTPGLRLINRNCVNKSFPAFWDSWEKIIPTGNREA